MSMDITAMEKILVLQNGETNISKNFVSELRSISKRKNIEIFDIKQQSLKDNSDKNTYIILGASALKEYLNKGIKSRAIVIFISKSVYYHTLKVFEHSQYLSGKEVDTSNITGIYSDPSPIRQIQLIKKYYPKSVTVGVILSPATAYIETELRQINLEKTKLKFAYKFKKSDINKTLNELKNVDVILAVKDKIIWNRKNIKNLILSTYRKEQPIFGYDKNLVKAGTMATTYSDISDISLETEKMLVKFNDSSEVPPTTYAENFEVTINDKVRKSFGFPKQSIVQLRDALDETVL